MARTNARRTGTKRRTVVAIVGLLATAYFGSLWFRLRAAPGTPHIIRSSVDFGVSPVLPLLIMYRESRGEDPKRVGLSGEIGIMQVTPPAMQQTGYWLDLSSTLYEQATSGLAYWKWLQLTYPERSVFWRVRAYNAGPGGANDGGGWSYLFRTLLAL